MAALVRVAQKVKSGLRGIATCVIKGKYQDIVFPENMFEPILEHAARYPLVSKVPTGRLIPVSPERPIQLQDHWRRILFTGLVHSINYMNSSDSIYDAYNLNNVGVIRDLNVLAFRKFDRVYGMKNTNHHGFCKFVEDLFRELYGPSAHEKLDELYDYLSLFKVEDSWADHFLLHNPFFLEEMGIAHFYGDTHRLVRHQFPARGETHSADLILKDIDRCYTNELCIRNCEKSVIIGQLLGVHAAKPRAVSIRTSKWPPDGSAVVDVHRHAVIHSIERNTLDKVRARTSSLAVLQLLKRFTQREVVEAMRYEFPLYPQTVVRSFADNGLWKTLGMHRRLPVPSIFGYVAPWRSRE